MRKQHQFRLAERGLVAWEWLTKTYDAMIFASFAILVCTLPVDIRAGESLTNSQTRDAANQPMGADLIIKSAPLICETNYESLAFDLSADVPDARMMHYFRFKAPDRYSFVVRDERTDLPVLIVTREGRAIYDVEKDLIRYHAESNRIVDIRFGMRGKQLGFDWTLKTRVGATKDIIPRMVQLDFPTVISMINTDLRVERNAPVGDFLFSGSTRRGSKARIWFDPKSAVPYHRIEIDTVDGKYRFKSIVGNARIDESVFVWDKSIFPRESIVLENARSILSPLDPEISAVMVLMQVAKKAPRRTETKTVKLLRESVRKMVAPVAPSRAAASPTNAVPSEKGSNFQKTDVPVISNKNNTAEPSVRK